MDDSSLLIIPFSTLIPILKRFTFNRVIHIDEWFIRKEMSPLHYLCPWFPLISSLYTYSYLLWIYHKIIENNPHLILNIYCQHSKTHSDTLNYNIYNIITITLVFHKTSYFCYFQLFCNITETLILKHWNLKTKFFVAT